MSGEDQVKIMTICTDCSVKNDLKYEMIIQGNVAWIYDVNEEFITDFQINFCPICGIDLKDSLRKEKD